MLLYFYYLQNTTVFFSKLLNFHSSLVDLSMLNLKICFHFLNKNINKKHLTKFENFYLKSKNFRCFSNAIDEPEIHLKEDLYDKIIYNDFIIKVKPTKSENSKPISLKYLTDSSNENEEEEKSESAESVHFPYEIKKKYIKHPTVNKAVRNAFSDSVTNFTPSDNESLVKHRWKTNYGPKLAPDKLEPRSRWQEIDENEEEILNDNIDSTIMFGTSNPKIPISSVPCGGCGALLHCTDMSIPGFLPQEVFKYKSETELQSEVCQRCHFLKEFDVALGVNVSSSEYPKIISEIQGKNALAILMIDLLDFPCSIWQGIDEIIGSKPVFVVGNKIDLFIQEGSWFVDHLKKCLIQSLNDQGLELTNIKHVCLISAKTGYGIEELINKLHKHWAFKGDVYLIGCTNVGKSSLFNALVQSDFCKVKAIDLMQRATISSWPGTTLNLIKFPILAPTGWRLYARTHRLIKESKDKHAYNSFVKKFYQPRLEQIPLSGYVGKTFASETETKNNKVQYLYDSSNEMKKGIDPNDPDFAHGRWCYDTPGVVNCDQIVNLLTTSELLVTVPKSMVLPRIFHLSPGYSIFIAGLARLDFVKGNSHVWFTVYACKDLPLTITKTEDADFVYENLIGTKIFRVPTGGEERLKKWPKLTSKKLEIASVISSEASGDIVLSSAGWVSVTLPSAHRCYVEAWTPEGRGIYLRKPSVIKHGHLFRGDRIRRTPAFTCNLVEIPPPSLNETPNFLS